MKLLKFSACCDSNASWRSRNRKYIILTGMRIRRLLVMMDGAPREMTRLCVRGSFSQPAFMTTPRSAVSQSRCAGARRSSPLPPPPRSRHGPGRCGAERSVPRPVLYTYTPSDRDRPAVHSADRLLPLDLMTAFHGFRHDALSR